MLCVHHSIDEKSPAGISSSRRDWTVWTRIAGEGHCLGWTPVPDQLRHTPTEIKDTAVSVRGRELQLLRRPQHLPVKALDVIPNYHCFQILFKAEEGPSPFASILSHSAMASRQSYVIAPLGTLASLRGEVSPGRFEVPNPFLTVSHFRDRHATNE